jgi:hypothetical protein
MNGYECGMCDMAPCVCKEIERRERIIEGKEAIQSMWQADHHLFGWRRLLVRLIWPDVLHVMEDIKEFYLANKRD